MSEFVRARCDETGAIAALPKEALKLGMIPGWVEVDGPVPSGPKPAAFPEQYNQAGAGTEGAAAATEEAGAAGTEDAGEQSPPDESADTKSARKKE